MCLSLDFELFWGLRDHNDLRAVTPRLLGARAAVPRLLELFARHGIHATWATVGFLMCRDKDELLASLPELRPRYANPALSPYAVLEGLGRDEREDPFHYAPSLVEAIRNTPGQEIGCHTFSHYYCTEAGQDVQSFTADLDAALALARRKGLELRSLVLPRNQINPAYLPVCAQRGITAYRGLERFRYAGGRGRLPRAVRLVNTYLPLSGSMAWNLEWGGLRPPVNLPGSHFLRPWAPRLKALHPLQLRRLRQDLELAARHNRVLHLWWHPHNFGLHTEANLASLEKVLGYFKMMRDQFGMQSLHMAELSERHRAWQATGGTVDLPSRNARDFTTCKEC